MDKEKRKRKESNLTNWFNAYIRLRDSDEMGRGACVSCGKIVQIGTLQAQAGHYYPDVNLFKSLKWDEKNVNLQCNHCNRRLEGYKQGYAIGLIRKYGQDVLFELDVKRQRKPNFDEWTLERLKEHYRKAFYNELKGKSDHFLEQYKNGKYARYAKRKNFV